MMMSWGKRRRYWCRSLATLLDVARAARRRVERTIVAELIMSMVDDAKASPIMSG